MKHVVLQRAWSDHRATLGMLTVVGVQHDPIFTLENPLRETIIDSRIPDGEYECTHHSGPKFENVFLVKNVPERTDILIHWGNFERDTKGCILLGCGAWLNENNEPMILNSKRAIEKFREIIGKEDFVLTVAEEITSYP